MERVPCHLQCHRESYLVTMTAHDIINIHWDLFFFWIKDMQV